MIYRRMQELLSEFTVEPITAENLLNYESIFYNNEEYYYLTDGHPATREICEASIEGYETYKVYSIGISQNGEAISFLSVLDGYPDSDTLYIGLLLVDDRFKRKAIGSTIMNALFSIAETAEYKNIKLSVQDNNKVGLSFWKKLGFYETDRCHCNGFDNLSMQYDKGTQT